MADLHGVLSAMATPFTPGGESVDEPALRALVERTLAGGVHGLVPCGSTGEFAALSHDERRVVAEIVIDQAAGRVPVVPHTGAMTTREAVVLSRHAEQAGAAGVMVVAPYYEPLSPAEISTYYRDIAQAISIDVMIYNLPMATGVNLTPADIAKLATDVPNIRYVKDTSGDLSQAARLIHDYGGVVSTFVGWDTLYLASLIEGSPGSVIGAANIVPAELAAIYDAVYVGDLAQARATWHEIFPLMQFLISGGYVSAVKGALTLIDQPINDPRLPIEPLHGSRLAELQALLRDIPALPAPGVLRQAPEESRRASA
jgi:4-hydroxy-tetrahydrodipicolinate synthase